MMFRVVVLLCALGVIGAATNINVLAVGGYASDAGPLVIAMAALLSVGTAFVAVTWSEGRRGAACALALCLLGGEIYWVFTNAEREIASRERLASPAAHAQHRREGAQDRINAAKEAKRFADLATVSEAAKPGCKAHCVNLLQSAQGAADRELAAARSDFEALPEPIAASPLPERLGIASWAWDLWMANLRALGIAAASIVVGLVLHQRRSPQLVAAQSIGPSLTAKRKSLPRPPLGSSAREHLSEFMLASARPEAGGQASLRAMHARYLHWCEAVGRTPLPAAAFGSEFRNIIDSVGLQCTSTRDDIVVHGAVIVP
jgi:hypothetical protein